jgi:hypothetical protein
MDAKGTQHGNDSRLVRRGLGALEHLGTGNLSDAVADKYPAIGDRSFCATGNVARQESENDQKANGIRPNEPDTHETTPFVIRLEIVDETSADDLYSTKLISMRL